MNRTTTKFALLLSVTCLIFTSQAFGQWSTITPGNWSNPAIWNTGTVPQTWGNITVTISHDVDLDADPQASTIDLTVDSGVSLTEIGGCRFITAWAAGSNFINNGTISCYYIDLPSATFTNNGTLNLENFQMHNAGDFLNNSSGSLTASQIGIYNNTNFTNYGIVNATGTSSPCFTPPVGISLFEFSGDDFYNNGTINAVQIGIYNCTSAVNDTAGVMSSDDYLDVSSGNFVFNNYGNIDMLGEFVLTNATFNNYNYVSVGTDLRNNDNAFLNNYGCDCFTQYDGLIDIAGVIANNTGVIDNNGVINVYGGYVVNYNQIGASACGLLNTTSTGIIDNSGTFFGDLVVVAGTVNCFSCTQEPSVYVTIDETIGCAYAVALPVELVSFDATKMPERKVLCEWTTNVEINSDYFVIERTQNGTSIDSVGWHSASGNSLDVISYDYIDDVPLDGISYYRLKIVDFNGSYEYSDWRSVDFNGIEIINLFPNPTNGNMTVLVGSSTDENIEIQIVDALGRYVYKESSTVFSGITSFFIDVSKYANGVYVFKVQTDSRIFVQKQFVVD
jgi:hypothetical protein